MSTSDFLKTTMDDAHLLPPRENMFKKVLFY